MEVPAVRVEEVRDGKVRLLRQRGDDREQLGVVVVATAVQVPLVPERAMTRSARSKENFVSTISISSVNTMPINLHLFAPERRTARPAPGGPGAR
jgi:hypothetical protein